MISEDGGGFQKLEWECFVDHALGCDNPQQKIHARRVCSAIRWMNCQRDTHDKRKIRSPVCPFRVPEIANL